jgi:phosphoribosylformylglycinamidine synthase
MMQSVVDFANKGGKVLGVCNGFQILCETGLLPGVLLQNANQQFICKNVNLTADINNEVYKIPIAHGDGRYYADDKLLDELEQKKQILFRYCSDSGLVENFCNPNGACRNIAGIRNENGNVFGMMPHPERATSKALNNTDGLKVFSILGLN